MTDNRASSMAAKVELRERALAGVENPAVFDAFAGMGTMFDRVWHSAAEYLGVDERWPGWRTEPRMVSDNKLALRSLDLNRYNIFDFDAYGAPWDQLTILGQRRGWGAEVVAIILTDGGLGLLGKAPQSLRRILGTSARPFQGKETRLLHQAALGAWCSSLGLVRCSQWIAESKRGAKGAQQMVYSATLVRKG